MRLIIFFCFLFIGTTALANDEEPVIVAEGFGPSACGLCDGYINLLFTNVNDGLAIINSSNGGPYSVFISSGIAQLLGMCEGDYNGLYVVVNGCLSPPVDVSVSLPLPTAPTSIGFTGCNGEPIPDINVTGNVAAIFTWYSDAALTNIIHNNTTWTPSGIIGAETVYVTQTFSGCESEATQVDIIIEVTPTIEATGNNPSACGLLDGWIDLTFTGVPDGFYDIAYSGGIWAAVEVTGGACTINSLGDGIYNNIQIVLGNCPSTLGENVVLTTDGAPSAPTAASSVYCSDETVLDITAAGDAGAVFTWYFIDPNTSEATIIDNDATWTPSGIIGTEIVYVTQTIGTCESITTEVTVTVNAVPSLDDLPDVSTCENYTLPIPTGINLTDNAGFFESPGGVNPIAAGSVISNTQTIYIYDANGNCSDEQDFLVTINESPDLEKPTSVIACETFDVSTVIPTDNNNLLGLTYTYHSDAFGSAGAILENTDITTSGDYYIVGNAMGCTDTTFVDITIVLLESPEAENGTYCFGELISDVIASGEATANFTWYDSEPSLPGSVIINTGNTYAPLGTIGTETIYVTQTVAGCVSEATEITVTINDCSVNTNNITSPQIIVSQSSINGQIKLSGELNHFSRIEVIAVNGSIVKNEMIEPSVNAMYLDLDTGFYIVRLKDDFNNFQSTKVVVY